MKKALWVLVVMLVCALLLVGWGMHQKHQDGWLAFHFFGRHVGVSAGNYFWTSSRPFELEPVMIGP